jgi:glutathione peroxidase
MMRGFVLTGFAAMIVGCTTSPTPASSSGTNASSSSGASGGSSSSGAGSSSSGNTSSSGGAFVCSPPAKKGELYELAARNLAGDEDVSMCEYRGKVLLMFNGASQCGNTPQYKPLQELYTKYAAQGFLALGFPCNQFGGQEPGSGAEISTFCTNEYGIKFPLFSKLEVNGAGAHPIYQWLKAQPVPAGDPTGDITWNFEKFLVGRDGKVVRRFDPGTQPDAPEVVAAIEAALAKP